MSADPASWRDRRAAQCRRWNASPVHQSQAGQARARSFTREYQRNAGGASWAAFSARWRAAQGLCPLSPDAVRRYVRPADIRAGAGLPLPEGLRIIVWSAWAAGVLAGVDAWLSSPFQVPAAPRVS